MKKAVALICMLSLAVTLCGCTSIGGCPKKANNLRSQADVEYFVGSKNPGCWTEFCTNSNTGLRGDECYRSIGTALKNGGDRTSAEKACGMIGNAASKQNCLQYARQ